MDDKITLDRETFKVLAADTRVDILKSISDHKKTLTDLSEGFGMSPSTIKEHLDRLVAAGLIYADDKGMKWKYYKLTGKGQNIVNPMETKVWILLGTTFLMLAGSLFMTYASLGGLNFAGVPMPLPMNALSSTDLGAAKSGNVMATATTLGETTSQALQQTPESEKTTPTTLKTEVEHEPLEEKAAGGGLLSAGAPSVKNAEDKAASTIATSTTVEEGHAASTTTMVVITSTTQPPLQYTMPAAAVERTAAKSMLLPYVSFVLVVVSAVLFGICAGYLLKRRLRII